MPAEAADKVDIPAGGRPSQVRERVVATRPAASRFTPPGPGDRLILVEVNDFDSSTARLSMHEYRDGASGWRQVGAPVPAVVGRAGVGWGHTFRHLARDGEPVKREGDKRAPAGVFALRTPFGFGSDVPRAYMQLTRGQHFCVDDAASERYSEIVPQAAVPAGTSGEKMWAIDLYRAGIVVDYPTDRAAKSGSCIFIHVWRTPRTPTVGCVAASETTVARLQRWVASAPRAVSVAIFPSTARARLGLDTVPR